MFWLKKKKRAAVLWLMVALLGLSSTAFYAWAGGPEKMVKLIKQLHIQNK